MRSAARTGGRSRYEHTDAPCSPGPAGVAAGGSRRLAARGPDQPGAERRPPGSLPRGASREHGEAAAGARRGLRGLRPDLAGGGQPRPAGTGGPLRRGRGDLGGRHGRRRAARRTTRARRADPLAGGPRRAAARCAALRSGDLPGRAEPAGPCLRATAGRALGGRRPAARVRRPSRRTDRARRRRRPGLGGLAGRLGRAVGAGHRPGRGRSRRGCDLRRRAARAFPRGRGLRGPGLAVARRGRDRPAGSAVRRGDPLPDPRGLRPHPLPRRHARSRPVARAGRGRAHPRRHRPALGLARAARWPRGHRPRRAAADLGGRLRAGPGRGARLAARRRVRPRLPPRQRRHRRPRRAARPQPPDRDRRGRPRGLHDLPELRGLRRDHPRRLAVPLHGPGPRWHRLAGRPRQARAGRAAR